MSPQLRKSAFSAAVLVLAAGSLLGPLSREASAQGLKIGVFDKQRIVDESKLGVAARERFEKVQAERESEVAEKQKVFEDLQRSYQQKAGVLSDDKRLEMQRDVARARDEWQSAAGNAGRDLERLYQQALLEIITKIDPVIEDYGRAQGYDLLFDRQQVEFFRKSSLDVTDKIIEQLNKRIPG